MAYSKEQLARIVGGAFAVFALVKFNSSVDAETLTNAVDAIYVNGGIVIAFIMDIVGYIRRYRKGDVTLGGFRK